MPASSFGSLIRRVRPTPVRSTRATWPSNRSGAAHRATTSRFAGSPAGGAPMKPTSSSIRSSLPPRAAALVDGALAGGAAWGRFDVRIDARGALLAVVAALINLRSRWTGIATGDQAIFVARAAFDAAGGYPDQPLMEDIELSRRLRRIGRPAGLRARVLTSGRRWARHGAWRTIVLMWWLRLRYWLGTPPDVLARAYR